MTKVFGFDGVTRVTVVLPGAGIAFEKYDAYPNGVEIHLQDNGKTLKLFPILEEHEG